MRAIGTAFSLLGPAILVMTAGCSQGPPDAGGDQARNQALVRRWIDEGFNQRNLGIVDELFIEHPVINGRVITREGVKQSMSRHLTAFPDLHVTTNETLSEHQKVGIWYTVQGTHTGEFEGIPSTGNRVEWGGVDLFRIEGGRIADARFLSDQHGLLTQLGLPTSRPDAQEGGRP